MSPLAPRVLMAWLLGAALLWLVIDNFDVSQARLLEIGVSILVVLGAVIVAAAICAGLWRAVRALAKRIGDR